MVEMDKEKNENKMAKSEVERIFFFFSVSNEPCVDYKTSKPSAQQWQLKICVHIYLNGIWRRRSTRKHGIHTGSAMLMVVNGWVKYEVEWMPLGILVRRLPMFAAHHHHQPTTSTFSWKWRELLSPSMWFAALPDIHFFISSFFSRAHSAQVFRVASFLPPCVSQASPQIALLTVMDIYFFVVKSLHNIASHFFRIALPTLTFARTHTNTCGKRAFGASLVCDDDNMNVDYLTAEINNFVFLTQSLSTQQMWRSAVVLGYLSFLERNRSSPHHHHHHFTVLPHLRNDVDEGVVTTKEWSEMKTSWKKYFFFHSNKLLPQWHTRRVRRRWLWWIELNIRPGQSQAWLRKKERRGQCKAHSSILNNKCPKSQSC